MQGCDCIPCRYKLYLLCKLDDIYISNLWTLSFTWYINIHTEETVTFFIIKCWYINSHKSRTMDIYIKHTVRFVCLTYYCTGKYNLKYKHTHRFEKTPTQSLRLQLCIVCVCVWLLLACVPLTHLVKQENT